MEVKYRYYCQGVEVYSAEEATHVEAYHETNQVFQVDTGETYPTAYDPYPSSHTYEVSEQLLDTPLLSAEEQLEALGVDPNYYDNE